MCEMYVVHLSLSLSLYLSISLTLTSIKKSRFNDFFSQLGGKQLWYVFLFFSKLGGYKYMSKINFFIPRKYQKKKRKARKRKEKNEQYFQRCQTPTDNFQSRWKWTGRCCSPRTNR